MIDCRIRNARILDGCGNPWFRGDVGVDRGRIAAVGDLSGTAARRDIDAREMVLAPGFIDPHTHSDFSIPLYPRGESKISQGVTTEVGGNCGLSPFPVNPDRLDLLRLSSNFLGAELTWEWRSAEDFFRHVESLPLSHNLVLLAGHCTLRIAAMGFEQRAPTSQELEVMKRLLADSMQAGAAGFSSGLIYAPSSYAEAPELVELCKVAAHHGGIYTTHMRNEANNLLDSIQETVSAAREANLPVEISHHKATGEANWGKVRESLAMVKKARQEGVDVTLDQYPYIGSSTTFTAFLPQWSLEGGVGRLLERVADPATRQKILEETPPHRGGLRWDQVMVSAVRKPEHVKYEGMMLADVGKAMGVSGYEAGLRLLEEARAPFQVIHFSMCEEDVEYVMRDPNVMVGSDGSSMSPARGSKPHPRNYGTNVRVLGHYVRERGVLTLEDAVRKMTSLPAQRFGLYDRGVIRPGAVADLVLFDPSKVRDTADYNNPHQYAEGIGWTMVAGELIWQEGQDTGASPGKLLRAQSKAR